VDRVKALCDKVIPPLGQRSVCERVERAARLVDGGMPGGEATDRIFQLELFRGEPDGHRHAAFRP
jgi:hypothetical protein